MRETAQAIVDVFEIGRPGAGYALVTVSPGDPGHLTYGRARATLAGGSLHLLVDAYVRAGGVHAEALGRYLPRLARSDLSLDHDFRLQGWLHAAGREPLMRSLQNELLDHAYWRPTLAAAAVLGITAPLGLVVIYDSRVHGSWMLLRRRTEEERGTVAERGERRWIRDYLEVRRAWLAWHRSSLLRRTVYRVEELDRLAADGAWALPLPIVVRGVTIDRESLATAAPETTPARSLDARLLRLARPRLRGGDVTRLQRRLRADGVTLAADGVYGAVTARAVRAFQRERGLVADGIVGAATRSALGF